MSGIFSAPVAPAAPPPPPAPPASPPTIANAHSQVAGANAENAAAAASGQGFSDTIKTSSQGVKEQTPVGKAELLGQASA